MHIGSRTLTNSKNRIKELVSPKHLQQNEHKNQTYIKVTSDKMAGRNQQSLLKAF